MNNPTHSANNGALYTDNPTLYAAIEAAQLGFSVVNIDPKTKSPFAGCKWKHLQTTAATPDEVSQLPNLKSFAIIGGAVSGGSSTDGAQLHTTCLDFDVDGFYERYKADVGELLDGLPVQRTGGGGYQALFRSPLEIPNLKLAFTPNSEKEDGREIAIETRGKGGYFLVPPSVHPSGNVYKWVSGDLSTVPTISIARAQSLLDAAKRLDEAPYTRQQLDAAKAREANAKPRVRSKDNVNIIGAFNQAHTIEELLLKNGYKRIGEMFSRPNVYRPSVAILESGSFHHSTNDPLHCDGHTQDAFSIFCFYDHGGDVKAAVKAAAQELGLNANSTLTEGTQRPLENQSPENEFEVFSLSDLARLPRPKWLVRGLLVENTISTITADGGGFKSFFTIELGLCIATGTPFHGREVKQGTVVYVAAEGFYTIYERVMAWCRVRGVEMPTNFHILRAPVNVSDAGQVARFTKQFKALSPDFVVLDTLSQNAIGLNENANNEMAGFMAGMAAVSHAVGSHVLAVHHNSKGTGNFRGAGAIKNNVDAHITLERPENDIANIVFVRCEKQRGKSFEPFALRGEEVDTGLKDEYGDVITSLVFELTGDEVTKTRQNTNSQKAEETLTRLMEVFDECDENTPQYEGVKVGVWKGMVSDMEKPICSDTTFWRHLKTLKGDIRNPAQIELCGSDGTSELWARVTPTPTTPTTPKTQNGSCGSKGTNLTLPSTTITTTPFKGGSCGSGSSEREIEEKKKTAKVSNHAHSEPYAVPPDAADDDELDFDSDEIPVARNLDELYKILAKHYTVDFWDGETKRRFSCGSEWDAESESWKKLSVGDLGYFELGEPLSTSNSTLNFDDDDDGDDD